MSKNISICLMIIALLAVGCGCQSSPDDDIVASKNDGVFEDQIGQSVFEEVEQERVDGEVLHEVENSTTEVKCYDDMFFSTDGTIEYTISLEEPSSSVPLPIVQITPHSITAEQARRIAEVIFEGERIYEYSADMSRTQLEEEILELRQHISNRDALVEYYGGDETIADQVVADYEERISRYEEMYGSAPDEIEIQLCDWEFHPQSYYDDPALGTAGDLSYNDTKYIKATSIIGGYKYNYSVANRDATDYRIHNIHAYMDDSNVDREEIYSSQIPSAAEVEDAAEAIKCLLDQMEIGDWVIESSDVFSFYDSRSGKTLYRIDVTATPVYEGVKVTNHEQLSNLKTDDAYASNYYYEEITAYVSNGRLLDFFYYSPHEVVSVINKNVQIMTFDEIISRLKTQLRLDEAEHYMGAGRANILIDDIELGLTRIRMKNNQDDFYLVPAYTVHGIIEPLNDDGSSIYYYMADGSQVEVIIDKTMLVINAVDGSIINTELGY